MLRSKKDKHTLATSHFLYFYLSATFRQSKRFLRLHFLNSNFNLVILKMSLMSRVLLQSTLVRCSAERSWATSRRGPKMSVAGSILAPSSSSSLTRPVRSFQTSSWLLSSSREEVSVTFVNASGEKMVAKGKVGDNLVRKSV